MAPYLVTCSMLTLELSTFGYISRNLLKVTITFWRHFSTLTKLSKLLPTCTNPLAVCCIPSVYIKTNTLVFWLGIMSVSRSFKESVPERYGLGDKHAASVKHLDFYTVTNSVIEILDRVRDVGGEDDDDIRTTADTATWTRLIDSIGSYNIFLTRPDVNTYMARKPTEWETANHLVAHFCHLVRVIFSLAIKWVLEQKPYLTRQPITGCDMRGVGVDRCHITAHKVDVIMREIVEVMCKKLRCRESLAAINS
jgi:hypothetical protein